MNEKNDVDLVTTAQAIEIIKAELAKENLQVNVKSLLEHNARLLDGKGGHKTRLTPELPRHKVNRRYFYSLHELSRYIGALIDFKRSGKRQQTIPRLERIHGLTAQEIIETFSEGFKAIELDDSTLYVGAMFGCLTQVLVSKSGVAYYLVTSEEAA